jgi:NADPH:quinone reductase-like Zn-dependent oxidoreductase
VSNVDLVLDLVAGDTQKRSWKSLRRGGRMVSTLQPPSKTDGALREATGETFMAQPNREELEEIGRLIDEGKVKVIVEQTMPIRDVRRAHEFIENAHVRGKLVLEVAAAG